MTMGEKILNMRKARGWNQEELAEHIGVTRQAVSRWESDSAKPDADKIITLCDLFGVSADYLLRDQYSGEGNKAQTEDQPIIRRAKAAWTALLAGGIMLLLLKLVYVVVNQYTLVNRGFTYMSFLGFLRDYELVILWFFALSVFLGGLLYLFIWPVIRKDKEKNPWPWERD